MRRERPGATVPEVWFGASLAVLAALSTGSIQSASPLPLAQAAGQPTFRVKVDLVRLDVIPRDERGQFVSNLNKDDFEVLEDGVKQEIVSTILVHGGRMLNLQAIETPRPVQDGLILPHRRPASDEAGRIFVILVDDLHVAAHDTPLVRDLMKKIAATLIHEGDMFAIVSTGPSAIQESLTYDRQRIPAAISKVTGSGLDPQEIFLSPRDSALGPGDVRRRAHVAFSTAYELIQGLERVRDRRKALLLLSNGYDFDPYPAARQGKDQVFGGRYGMPSVDPADEERGELFLTLQTQQNRFSDFDLASELRALVNAANRANVTVYSIDPRGIAGFIGADQQLGQDERKIHLQKTQSSLRTLAEATGGIAVVNSNDFAGALKRIDAETSDYYVLGYYLSNSDPARRTRQIEVKVNRAGVKVWSRSSYTLKPRQAAGSSPPR